MLGGLDEKKREEIAMVRARMREAQERVASKQYTPLMRAAVDRDVTSLAQMLALGNVNASLFVKDFKGRTALDWARLTRNELAIAMLKKAMKTEIVNARQLTFAADIDKDTFAKDVNEKQIVEIFNALRERDEKGILDLLSQNKLFRDEVENVGDVFFIDAHDESGEYTPLILAAGWNMKEAVAELIDKGVAIDDVNKFGHTAFTWACAGGHVEVIRELLMHGADIHHRTLEGRTGLHYACLYAKARVVKSLLDFLYERFSTYRLKHDQKDFDASRWARYATFLEEFIDIKDNQGLLAFDLVPQKEAGHILDSTEALINSGELNRIFGIAEQKEDNNLENASLGKLGDSSVADNQPPSSPGSISRPAGVRQLRQLVNAIEFQALDPEFLLHDAVDAVMPQMNAIQKTFQGLGQGGLGETNAEGLDEFKDHDDFDDFSANRDSISDHDSIDEDNRDEDNELDDPDVGNEEERPWTATTEKLSYVEPNDDVSSKFSQDSYPNFSRDTDNLHAEAIHNIGSADSIRTAQSYPLEVAAINMLFQKARDRIDTWRISADKEYELKKLRPCWLMCGHEDSIEEMPFHLRFDCPFRLIECIQCRHPIRFCETKVHMTRKCLMRTVGCPWAWKGCKEMLLFKNVEKHMKIMCTCREVLCRNNCGKSIPHFKRYDHEQTHCKYRLIECEFCKKRLKSRNMGKHLHHKCAQRLVLCGVGCGNMIKAKDKEYHEVNICRAPCRWDCGLILGPLQKKAFHEKLICLKRPVTCKFDCDMGGLTAEFIEEHERNQCTHTTQHCPKGCGNRMKRKDIDRHLDSWLGDCPERFVRCPSNLIGWKIFMYDSELEGIILQYKREYFENVPASSISYNGTDKWYVRFEKKHEWIDLWQRKFLLLEKTIGDHKAGTHKTCLFECGWIPSHNLNDHLANTCMQRSVWLKGAKDLELADFKGQKTSFKNAIAMAELRDQLDAFQDAPPPNVTCEYCAFEISLPDYENHKRFKCGSVVIRCSLGCGIKIQRQLLQEHVTSDCPKRVVVCEYCGEDTLWAEELRTHQLKMCSSLPKECLLGCGTPGLNASNEENHRLFECQKRMITCTCGTKMEFCEHPDHMIADCPDKMSLCPQGCGAYMQRTKVDYHIEKECTNKDYYYSQEIFCPINCGTRIIRINTLEHVTYFCDRRLTECPLKCGNSVQFDKLRLHLYYCPQRTMCCERGMNICKSAIHNWFYFDESHIDEDHATNDPFSERASGSLSEIGGGNHWDVAMEPYRDDDDQLRRPLAIMDDGTLSQVTGAQSNRIEQDYPSRDELVNSITDTRSTKSSLFIASGGQMALKSSLRMYKCRRHGVTLLMATVRMNELPMVEYVLRVTHGRDLDYQNDVGETALTIACKLGYLKIAELLLLSSADVNMETTSGKTALIEAVSSNNPNPELLELLVEVGAIVKYKTKKHGQTALYWARNMKYAQLVRILSLAELVQKQTDELFIAISIGNSDAVNQLLESGDFFDPNNEQKVYDEMERFIELARERALNTRALKERMTMLTNLVENARSDLNKCKEEREVADVQMDIALIAFNKLNSEIAASFTKYELAGGKLLRGDIEEIARMKYPDESTRIALFAFGLLMNILTEEDWPTSAYSKSDIKKWWPLVGKSFVDSTDCQRRLKAFSIDRLRSEMARPLLARTRIMYQELSKQIILENKMHDEGRSSDISSTNITSITPEPTILVPAADSKAVERGAVIYDGLNPVVYNDETHEKVVPKVVYISVKNSNAVSDKRRGEVEIVDLINPPAPALKEQQMEEDDDEESDSDGEIYEIPDADWDSEAEEAGGGEFIKGEWVPVNRKKERWWEREKLKNKKRKSKEIESQIANNSTSNNIDESHRKQAVALDIATEALKALENKSEKDQYAHVESLEMNPFVKTIWILLQAANKLELERSKLADMKQVIVDVGQVHFDIKVKESLAHARIHDTEKLRAICEDELLASMKQTRYYLGKGRLFRERLRVVRLLGRVSITGHTPISWAASLGNYEAVDVLLSKGGTVGFNSELLHLTARFLQLSYKIYRYIKGGRLVNDVKIEGKGDNVVEKIFKLREDRTRILNKLQFKRTNFRFPVPEAAYTGKWEIIERINERRLLHMNFLGQWCYPSPSQPYIRHNRHHQANKKISIASIQSHGMSDIAAGQYVEGVGWVFPGDSRDVHGIAQEKIGDILRLKYRAIEIYQAERLRQRLLNKEKRNQVIGTKEMVLAIKNRDFKRCLYLAQSMSSTIDFETEDGFTPLIAAAEENLGMIGHSYLLNENDKPCLAVEYLLDRPFYRPGINVETKTGMTALIKAASQNRYHVLQSLLDRGADMNYKNQFGKTALHYAAAVSSTECCRILLERGCECHPVDNEGLTPYVIADNNAFSNIMKLISQHASGNLGPVRPFRGRVNESVTCPLGCGLAMYNYEVRTHILICDCRDAVCPRGCGQQRLMERDMKEHMDDLCTKRPVRCEQCSEQVPFDEKSEHLVMSCPFRMVSCTLGCGVECKAIDRPNHEARCTWRIMECGSDCGESFRICDNLRHSNRECILRRVSCSLKCGNFIVFKNIKAHQDKVCPNRQAECRYCLESFQFKDLGHHESKCDVRREQCPAKCGEMVCIQVTAQHLAETCIHRFIPCNMNCGLKVRLIDEQNHYKKKCENRLVFCPMGCIVDLTVTKEDQVVTQMQAKQVELHLKYQCPNREVICKMCNADLIASNVEIHNKIECPFRPANCRLPGCLKTLPFHEREEHERHQCRFRLITCPQGCGEIVSIIRANKHMNNLCSMRYVECPLQCGEKMRHNKLHHHIEHDCVRRHAINNASFGDESPSRAPSRLGSVSDGGNRLGSVSDGGNRLGSVSDGGNRLGSVSEGGNRLGSVSEGNRLGSVSEGSRSRSPSKLRGSMDFSAAIEVFGGENNRSISPTNKLSILASPLQSSSSSSPKKITKSSKS